jgi:hypothetical protein
MFHPAIRTTPNRFNLDHRELFLHDGTYQLADCTGFPAPTRESCRPILGPQPYASFELAADSIAAAGAELPIGLPMFCCNELTGGNRRTPAKSRSPRTLNRCCPVRIRINISFNLEFDGSQRPARALSISPAMT